MGNDRKCPDAPAKEFPVKTRRKGNDGNWWVTSSTKSGMMRWKPFIAKADQKEVAPKSKPSPTIVTTTARTVAKLEKEKSEQNGSASHDIVGFCKRFTPAANELRKRGIYARVKPAGKDLDTSAKNIFSEMTQHVSWDPELTPFIFYTENAVTRAREYGSLYLTFRLPSKKSKLIAREVLSKHFKGKCEWDGKDSTKIIVNIK